MEKMIMRLCRYLYLSDKFVFGESASEVVNPSHAA